MKAQIPFIYAADAAIGAMDEKHMEIDTRYLAGVSLNSRKMIDLSKVYTNKFSLLE
ncbi:MAG: hypothetical protein U0Z26_15780 [Anaerolineales bacterium]